MRRAQDRARSATIESRALGALKLAREACDENVPAKRADFFCSDDLFTPLFTLSPSIIKNILDSLIIKKALSL